VGLVAAVGIDPAGSTARCSQPARSAAARAVPASADPPV